MTTPRNYSGDAGQDGKLPIWFETARDTVRNQAASRVQGCFSCATDRDLIDLVEAQHDRIEALEAEMANRGGFKDLVNDFAIETLRQQESHLASAERVVEAAREYRKLIDEAYSQGEMTHTLNNAIQQALWRALDAHGEAKS